MTEKDKCRLFEKTDKMDKPLVILNKKFILNEEQKIGLLLSAKIEYQ